MCSNHSETRSLERQSLRERLNCDSSSYTESHCKTETRTTTMATPPAPPKSNTRRDALLKLEAQVQQQWENDGTFEADAQEGKPKFFVTFPHATVSHHKTIKGGEG